jgi:S-DNA-T family DNA segregation ATPase FtsK/SpoIIIE
VDNATEPTSYPQVEVGVGPFVAVSTQTSGVRIELTAETVGRSQDVAVAAPDSAALADVLPSVATAVGAGADAELWCGDRLLRRGATIAAAGLRIGSRIRLGAPPARRQGVAVLALHVVGGPNAGLMVALERGGRLQIGRDSGCDIVLADGDASRRHAVVEVTASAIRLRDLGSTNGTMVDGRAVAPQGVELRPGALIAIGDSLLTVSGPIDSPATVQPGSDGRLLVLRPPRRHTPVPDREIELPVRATAMRPRGVQWITALLPAAAGGAIAWITHSPQFLLFALLSPVMMVSTALGDRVHWRRSRRRDAATFTQRRAAADREIALGLAVETAARRAAAPDPAAVLGHALLPSSRLWERRRSDCDVLRVRLGTADLTSTLRTREGPTSSPAGTLAAVPLEVDLRRGPLGVAGPTEVAAGLTRWLVGQLATLHSPADVELALLLAPEVSDGWAWARWLPHLRGRVATSADEWPVIVAELAAVVDQRLADRRLDPDGWRGPWFVLVIDRAGRLADVPGLAGLIARGSAVGLTAICIDTEVSALPTSCAGVARVHGTAGTRLSLRTESQPTDAAAVIDQVSATWADDLARSLAPLVDAGTSGASALPDSCRLLDVLDVDRLDADAIKARWAGSAGGARTPIGRCADGRLEVDLVADGPHALIAGTTGAGKSELLQSLVAGLASSHPPDEINFLLVDYKGGAAFADCARVPHTAGLVTDLDPYLTERALRSLNSELRRRERLFAARGAADLAGYRAAGPSEAVARLVIVVDEFAALVEELPDFVRGLIGVAQRGRSLGVHLVLATQRPGSAVSAEIKANTSLRIALRVTDPGDSTDVIDAPDAASIERARPGRAYLRSGSALTCFQVAHGAGVASADPEQVEVVPLGPWRRMPHRVASPDAGTDIARLVDAIAAAAGGRVTAHSPWTPPLPESLPRDDLDPAVTSTSIGLARIDLPDEQRTAALAVDVGAGASVLAAGTTRSGRTSMLISLAVGATTQLGPDRLHVHVLDPTGELAATISPLPHCATVLGPHDTALAPRLLRRLERECSLRITQKTGRAGPPGDTPRLLVLVDGWDTLVAGLSDIDAATCVDAVAGLLRIGPAAGLSIALTGDRTVLAPRFAGGFAERILLRLPDRSDYGLAGIAARAVPTAMPPGRGLRAGDGAALQIAHAGSGPLAADAACAVSAVAPQWAATPLGPAAIRIRSLPAHVSLAELPAALGRLAIGLGGDQLDPLTLDPFDGAGRLLIAGPPRSGRTTVLVSLAQQAAAAGIATLVAATSRSALAGVARSLSMPVIAPADTDVGTAPGTRTLLLVDDSEAFLDSPAGERLASWVRAADAPLAAVVAGRADDLATTYRGVAAEVRRSHCGILLRPGPIDGELLGVRLPRRPTSGPPGRGVVVGEPRWGPLFEDGEPVPVQVATP